MLALVQIALVVLVFLKLESHEDRMDELVKSAAQIKGYELAAKPASLLSKDASIAAQSDPDRQQLRRVLREELQAALSDGGLTAQNATPIQESPVYDEAEMQYQRELVVEEMQALKDQLEVSSGDLDRLMGDIAKLNPEARTELLEMLNRALNRGEIKGHL